MVFPPVFNCTFCSKVYTKEQSYNKHKLICEILSNGGENNFDQNYKNLGIQNLSLLVIELVKSNDKLQKDILELKNWVQIKKEKLRVIDWLNENYIINQNFNEFLSRIEITPSDLKIIFNSNFIIGASEILQYIISQNKIREFDIPLKSFDQKDNLIYVFKEKWEILSQEDFEKIFDCISKGILIEFKKWQEENNYRLYSEDFSSVYIENLKKIMGGGETFEKQKKIIHKNLYKYLKINLQKIIKYEFL